MKQVYTSKLFYNKFPFKIVLSRTGDLYGGEWSPRAVKTWLKKQKIQHKLYCSIVDEWMPSHCKYRSRLNVSVFIENLNDFNSCLTRYKKRISSITRPYDDSHVEILKNNINVVIRENLLYKKFKYIITFDNTYQKSVNEINEWIVSTLIPTTTDNTLRWNPTMWESKLYLADEDNVMLVKLTWADRIKDVTMICTYNELKVEDATNQ